MSGGNQTRSNLDIVIAAAPANDTLIIEAHPNVSVCDFQSGGVFFISSQQISDSQRMTIERATARNAELTKPDPAKILDSR